MIWQSSDAIRESRKVHKLFPDKCRQTICKSEYFLTTFLPTNGGEFKHFPLSSHSQTSHLLFTSLSLGPFPLSTYSVWDFDTLVSFVCSKQQIMGRSTSSPVEKLTPNLVLVNVITDLMTILSRGPWHGRPEVMFRQLPYESFFHQLTQRTWGLWGGSTHKNTVGDWESQNDNIIDCNKWHFDGFLNRYLFSLSDLGDTI